MSGERSFWDELAYWTAPGSPRFKRVELDGLAAWLPIDGRGYEAIGEQIDREIREGKRLDPWHRVDHDPGDEDRS